MRVLPLSSLRVSVFFCVACLALGSLRLFFLNAYVVCTSATRQIEKDDATEAYAYIQRSSATTYCGEFLKMRGILSATTCAGNSERYIRREILTRQRASNACAEKYFFLLNARRLV